jgi:hypothetical protein
VGGPGGPGDIEKVTVRYDWTPMTPFIRPLFDGGQLTLVVDSAMRNERRFE